MEIEVPKRAEYLRVLFCELSRIESHLIWLGTHLIDLGATTPLFYCFRERETIRDLFEEVCGARMTHAYLRIGGVREDIPGGFLGKVREFTGEFEKRMAEYETAHHQESHLPEASQGVGRISADDAVAWGLSGPSPGIGCGVGPPEGRALRGLRRTRFRRPRGGKRRRLRPLSGEDRGDAAEPEARLPGGGKPPRGAGVSRSGAPVHPAPP